MRDIESLRAWIRVAILIAAVGSLSVPIVYSMTPWRSRPIGRVVMLQAAVFATAICLSALFSFWAPKDILVIFWVNAIVLTAIAVATSSLSYMIWRLNHPSRKQLMMQMTNGAYDITKKIAQIYLPALGTLYFALAQIWGLPSAEEVSGTVLAVDTFLGVLLGLSSKNYVGDEKKIDGTVAIVNNEDGTSELRLKSFDFNSVAAKNESGEQREIVFRIVR